MASVLSGTRLQIARLLQRDGTDTVESLADKLGLAAATVRRHLDIMQRDGVVAFEELRKGTGRPCHSFRLSEAGQEALPKAYDRFLTLMLQEIAALKKGDLAEKDGNEALSYLLRRMASSFAGTYPVPVNGPFQQRLDTLMNVMQDIGYSPDVERRDGSVFLHVRNCPFRSVAQEIEATCLFDQEFIAALIGRQATRVQCMARGNLACCYDLGKA
jgi:predicted ArsR family transcriptional regulator